MPKQNLNLKTAVPMMGEWAHRQLEGGVTRTDSFADCSLSISLDE